MPRSAAGSPCKGPPFLRGPEPVDSGPAWAGARQEAPRHRPPTLPSLTSPLGAGKFCSQSPCTQQPSFYRSAAFSPPAAHGSPGAHASPQSAAWSAASPLGAASPPASERVCCWWAGGSGLGKVGGTRRAGARASGRRQGIVPPPGDTQAHPGPPSRSQVSPGQGEEEGVAEGGLAVGPRGQLWRARENAELGSNPSQAGIVPQRAVRAKSPRLPGHSPWTLVPWRAQ